MKGEKGAVRRNEGTSGDRREPIPTAPPWMHFPGGKGKETRKNTAQTREIATRKRTDPESPRGTKRSREDPQKGNPMRSGTREREQKGKPQGKGKGTQKESSRTSSKAPQGKEKVGAPKGKQEGGRGTKRMAEDVAEYMFIPAVDELRGSQPFPKASELTSFLH